MSFTNGWFLLSMRSTPCKRTSQPVQLRSCVASLTITISILFRSLNMTTTMKNWNKLSVHARQVRIHNALADYVNFSTDPTLGYPVSQLDEKVLSKDVPFLKDAPTLQVYVENPNHIGCHTYGSSEKAFRGTQQLE